MKTKHIIYLLLSLLCCYPYNLRAQNPRTDFCDIDILKYSFHIDISDEHDTVFCRALVRFAVQRDMETMTLDLVSREKNQSGMLTTQTEMHGKELIFRQTDGHLVIYFPNPLDSGLIHQVSISYHGVPLDGLIISENDYGDRTFFGDNWPDRAKYWLPVVDKLSDKAKVEFHITAPVYYETIANGRMVEETILDTNRKFSRWITDVDLPTKVMVFGAAKFAVNYQYFNNLPLVSYVFPQDRIKGRQTFSVADDILAFYISLIGDFPYKKLANVQSKTIYGGMENASAIFYNENMFGGYALNNEILIAHETAHQWFGDAVTEKTWGDIWLSEGFADYLSYLYAREKYSDDLFRHILMKSRNNVMYYNKNYTQTVQDQQVNELRDLLNTNTYDKAAWILHMLNSQTGSDVFRKILQTYYQTYKHRNASTEDFIRVVNTVTGKDYNDFFHQWLSIPGNLHVDCLWKYYTKSKKIRLDFTQKTYQDFVFSFPLKVRFLYDDGSGETEEIHITRKKYRVEFNLQEKPSKIILDPGCELLFEYEIEEE